MGVWMVVLVIGLALLGIVDCGDEVKVTCECVCPLAEVSGVP